MALLTVQTIGSPSTPTYTAISASDTVLVDGGSKFFIHFKNSGGGANTVTVDDAGTTPGGSAASDPTFSVPATTGDRMYYINPLLASSTGIVTFSNSATTGGTCAVFRI